MKAHKIRLSVIAALLIAVGLVGCGGGEDFFFFLLGLPKFLFTVGDADVGAFTVDPNTGAVTPVSGSPFTDAFSTSFPVCPDNPTPDPMGKFLFVPDACNDDIAVFNVDQTTGALTAVAGSPFPTTTGNFNCEQAVTDPSGKFLYVTEDSPAQILGFNIAADGSLTVMAGSPFAAGGEDNSLVIDPRGKFLYVSDGLTPGSITVFSIDSASGALTPIAGSPFALADTPGFLAIDPAGKFLYATAPETNRVLAVSIDGATGALTPVAGSPFAAGPTPQGISVGPNGKFLFVANAAEQGDAPGNVFVYTINPTTGSLTLVVGVIAGPNPKRLAADPSGKFLYVTNEDSDNMSVFSVNESSGALTEIAGSPFATNVGSEGIAITHR